MTQWISRLATAGAAALLVCGASPAFGSTESRALTEEGYSRAYELRFAESLATLGNARLADPSDPAPARAVAAVTWMEILCAQGVATFEAFEGDASGDAVSRPAVDRRLSERFSTHIDAAVQLAQRQLTITPHDIDAQYQLGASSGLLALYHGTVEGRTFAAFREGRRAVAIMERIRQRDPTHREAALIPGMYRYAISTLSWPKRMIAGMAGLPADREGGIQLLERAAADSAATVTDASLILTIVYNREGRHAEAAAHLTRLQARHRGNRLLALNMAATALAASEPQAAVKAITEALALHPTFAEPMIPGERAMWLYIRGAARASLHDPGALEDLRQSLGNGPRDWIRARAHLELCGLALRARDYHQVQADCDAAVYYGERGADNRAVERAKRMWRERNPS